MIDNVLNQKSSLQNLIGWWYTVWEMRMYDREDEYKTIVGYRTCCGHDRHESEQSTKKRNAKMRAVVIQSHIRPLSDMPRKHRECDRAVAGFALMRKGYHMLYTSARIIGMGSEDPASVIFLDCARPEER